MAHIFDRMVSRRVRSPEARYVVLHPADRDALGHPLGVEALPWQRQLVVPGGVHLKETQRHRLKSQPSENTRLQAAVLTSDGVKTSAWPRRADTGKGS